MISDIFVPTGDIGGQGRGQECVRGGASGHRAPREVGRGVEGEAGSEGWIGESGGSDATSDAETEEDEEDPSSPYLGAYLGPQKELEVWIKPQVKTWAHRVGFLCK